MIILDLQQIMISNLLMSLNKIDGEINEDFIRHMILNSIRANKTKMSKYGELVIACDSRNSWRKQLFPYYKANRKASREASALNWPKIFEILNNIREELKVNFQYRVIHVDTAEADDIIATLARRFAKEAVVDSEMIIIVSGDKDFKQLHYLPDVYQYDPVRKKFVHEQNPQNFIIEHIIKGDPGDGIPNVLSDDDTFVKGIRQHRISKKRMEEWKTDINWNKSIPSKIERNYKRNQMLIDLNHVPFDIQESIIKEYDAQGGKDRSKIMNYFIQKKLKYLMESINEF
ncbi:MAG TPA: hypothetical protein VIY47_04030 [Ignavibacteriaceae bacterium]